MPYEHYIAYAEWIEDYLPHIVYGADGARAVEEDKKRRVANPSLISGARVIDARGGS